MPNTSRVAGVLPVLKNPGPTSHDVVQIARRALREKQIGHTGTLDPAAGGMLVLCIGPYTKLVPYLTESDKTYTGEIALGIETSTDDSEGDPLMCGDASGVTLERLRGVAARFAGDIEQVPPRYAAVKVAGKKLYEYARQGVEVHVEPRPVTVFEFRIDSLEPMETPGQMLAGAKAAEGCKMQRMRFTVRVSAGTYVRALARDIGRELGCGGYLLALWRSAIGAFTDERAIPLDLLRDEPARANDYILRGMEALGASRMPVLEVLTAYKDRIFRGQPLHDRMMENMNAASGLKSGTTCAIASEEGALLAIMQAERFEEQQRANVYDSRFQVHFRPVRVFPNGLK
jgi:tRNA pseudouridine(55) synthase